MNEGGDIWLLTWDWKINVIQKMKQIIKVKKY